jgi:hypothetical protein
VSGFVPVPDEALEAVEPHEWHAVVDLYRRGRALRWQPFTVTERSLETRWRITGRRVWAVLDQLAEMGLITLERGTKRTPSRVTVLCPTAEAWQPDQQPRQQNDAATARSSADSVAQDGAQNGALLTRDLERETRSPPTPPPGEAMGGELILLPTAADPDPEPDAYDLAAAYWTEHVLPALGRENGSAPGRDTKLGRELARSLKRDPASVMDAMRFVAEGSADRAAFLRDRYAKSVTVKTVLTHIDEYAELWRAEGTGPPARAAPAYHRAPQPEPEAEIRRPPPRSNRP